MLTGSCNCGAVRFAVKGPHRSVSACHCGQCRKQSGHIWASAVTQKTDLEITGTPNWYDSSSEAKRGFCGTCGSFLFWSHNSEATISFALGALDGPTGLHLEKHIFVADKGDYYDIADDVPQQDN